MLVAAGAETGDIDFQLGTGGTITGLVVDGVGDPIVDAVVSAASFDGTGYSSAVTAADGTYTLTALIPGAHRVSANAFEYAPRYYDNAYNLDDADFVLVADQGTTTDIDFVLTAGGTISGVVTDSGNSDPVPFAQIYAERTDECCGYGYGTSNGAGAYTINGLPPGTYRIQATALGYPPQFYDSVFTYDAATLVPVAEGATVENIDIGMVVGGQIAGFVTDLDGDPIEGAHVSASSDLCCSYGQSETAADGSYAITTLAPGAYRVFVSADQFAGEYFDDKYGNSDAQLVIVDSGLQTNDINFALAGESRISGKITSPGGSPISGAVVWVYSDLCCLTMNTSTGSDGSYSIGNLAPGSYRVQAAADGFASEYFDNSYDYSAATLVTLAVAEEETGVDVELAPEARISGVVTDENGVPISNAYIYASPDACCSDGGSASTDNSGAYVLRGWPRAATW